jgi:hypothetical protein
MPMLPVKKSRAARIRIRFPVEVRGSRQSFRAEATDLSVEGLCCRSPILLVAGERAGISLLFQGASPIQLSFEVRWIRPAGASHYLTGVEFVHTPVSRKAFQQLIWRVESGELQGAKEARVS